MREEGNENIRKYEKGETQRKYLRNEDAKNIQKLECDKEKMIKRKKCETGREEERRFGEKVRKKEDKRLGKILFMYGSREKENEGENSS